MQSRFRPYSCMELHGSLTQNGMEHLPCKKIEMEFLEGRSCMEHISSNKLEIESMGKQ